MKYVVILCDGMSGEPLEALGGKTTLEYANTPNMDALAGMGEMGMVQNVPADMKPGSDVANLAVMGYDPAVYYSGRSPLEALSLGIEMDETDIIYRCNVVTLTEEEPYEAKTIVDHSSGEIETQDTDILMDAVRARFNNSEFRFYTGTSYRNITVWKNGKAVDIAPPHDCLTQVIGRYLPEEPKLRAMMEESFPLLNAHPLNLDRAARGQNKANSLWFWGAGTKPSLPSFEAVTGKRGAMISAVDLLKGIAVGSGMTVLEVPGATGSLHTNYEGKAEAAVRALLEQAHDFVYVHLEGPDEMAHQGLPMDKVQAIEWIDSRIVAPIIEGLKAAGEEFRMLILPDHPNPIRLRTHTGDPVPYILYDSTRQRRAVAHYSERDAAATGIFRPEGHKMMAQLLQQED